MALSPRIPTIDASTRVLPDLYDFYAEHNPDLPWAVYPASDTTTSSISFSEIVRASHRAAHLLGRREGDVTRDVVVMLIHCDTILYVTMLLGIARAGMVPFPISPRNSPEAITHLLSKTSARHVLTQRSLSHLLSNAQAAFTPDGVVLHIHELPDIGALYPSLRTDAGSVEDPAWLPYPPCERPQDNDMALYIHSSGSTGLPKPIPLTQKVLAQWMTHTLFPSSRAHNIRWAAMALPAFHTMGILTHVLMGLATGIPIALYPPKSPAPPVVPSPQNIVDTARLCGCNGCIVVPSQIEVWAESEDALKFMKSLEILAFGGGPLSTEYGNKLVASGVKLASGYGLTEAGPVAHIFEAIDSDPSDSDAKHMEDWQWQSFPPTTKPRFVPQGDGTYELQFLTCETHQLSIENLPDVKGYATADLWVPHPVKKGLWKIIGRKDDVIVLSSGEKIVPIPQERHIASHPLVADTIMFGRAKPHAGVLIDPSPEHGVDPNDKAAVTKYIDEIWPYIEQANQEAPAFARIFRQMIVVTDPARPLPRAAKGNAIRNPSLEKYADAIEHLYKETEAAMSIEPTSLPVAWTADNIEDWLSSLATSLNHEHPLLPTVDVFEQGFDSLHATFLRNHIINAFRAAGEPDFQHAASLVDQNIVYKYPTIKQLAAFIVSIISAKDAGSRVVQQTQLMTDFIAKYAADLPTLHPTEETPKEDIVVLLTGSTGSIGSYILASLLADARVAKVYAFNRASRSQVDRHLASFEDRGLPTELLNGHKYVSLVGDLNLDDFGLPGDVFKELASAVTHIVHNAWRVDFNLALGSYESQISGTRKLLDLCASCDRPVRMLFTSSISVAASWPLDNGLVPETPLSDPAYASVGGYSASKYVVEQLLDKARQNGFEAASLRVGQVCGSKASGSWNATDWVPILVKSSRTMGCLPDLGQSIDWIPIDDVAGTVVDLMFAPGQLPQLINVLHPRPVPWKQVVNPLCESLNVSLPVISLSEWVNQLERLSENAQAHDIDTIPAIKLLSFFRTISTQQQAAFDTRKAQEISQTMHDIKPLGHDHVSQWIHYWTKKGFL